MHAVIGQGGNQCHLARPEAWNTPPLSSTFHGTEDLGKAPLYSKDYLTPFHIRLNAKNITLAAVASAASVVFPMKIFMRLRSDPATFLLSTTAADALRD